MKEISSVKVTCVSNVKITSMLYLICHQQNMWKFLTLQSTKFTVRRPTCLSVIYP